MTPPNQRVDLIHPSSPLKSTFEDEEKFLEKIESFLKEKNYYYALRDPENPSEGFTIWLPEVNIQSDYPGKNEELAKISELGHFLLDTLKLKQNCLHFIFSEIAINGDGNLEEIWVAVDETVFEELTGKQLPKRYKSPSLTEFLER